jgi:hypothetical protein
MTDLRGRIGRAPLAAHALALFLILVLAAGWVDVSRAVFETDEGGLLIQARHLAEQGEWWIDYPSAALDPAGRYFTVANSRFRDGQAVTFPVRPVLVQLTAALWAWGGVFGATLLGIGGVTVAATAAGSIAGSVEPAARIPTLWITGLASPLAFDALSLRGHGAAAGATGIAIWAALRALDHEQPWVRAQLATASAAALLGATLVRRESMLLAGALALGLVLHAAWVRRPSSILLGLAVAAGAAGGAAVDQWMVRGILGTSSLSPPSGQSGSFISNRLSATSTLVLPGFASAPPSILFVTLAAVAIAAITAIRYLRGEDAGELTLGAAIVAALLVVRALLGGHHLVRGLIPAFPLGVAGFILGARYLTDLRVRLLVITALGFLGAVAATQYPIGGGIEWGSRFTFVGLPAITPVVGIGVVRAVRSFTAPVRQRIVALGAVVVIALAPTAMGLSTQRTMRAETAHNLDAGAALAEALAVNLVMSTHFEVPRTAIDQFAGSETRWFWAPGDRIVDLLEILSSNGYATLPLYTRDVEALEQHLSVTSWHFEPHVILPLRPDTVVLGVVSDASAG